MSELVENGNKARSRMRLNHVWSGMHVLPPKSHSWCSIRRWNFQLCGMLVPTLALGTAAPSFAANSTTSAANWLMPGIAWFFAIQRWNSFSNKSSVKSIWKWWQTQILFDSKLCRRGGSLPRMICPTIGGTAVPLWLSQLIPFFYGSTCLHHPSSSYELNSSIMSHVP